MLTSLKSLNLVRLLKAIPLHSTMKTKTGMYIACGLSLVGNTCNSTNLHNVGACKEVNYVLHHSKGHSLQWNKCARPIRPWFTNNFAQIINGVGFTQVLKGFHAFQRQMWEVEDICLYAHLFCCNLKTLIQHQNTVACTRHLKPRSNQLGYMRCNPLQPTKTVGQCFFDVCFQCGQF